MCNRYARLLAPQMGRFIPHLGHLTEEAEKGCLRNLEIREKRIAANGFEGRVARRAEDRIPDFRIQKG